MSNVHAIQAEPAAATFEDFWREYPRKVAKPLARAKFEAITNGGLATRTLDRDSGLYVNITIEATPEDIVEAAKRYRRSLVGPDFRLTIEERFIPHPATWLNQGRFEDQ